MCLFESFHLSKQVLLTLLLISSKALNLITLCLILIGESIMKIFELCDKTVFLFLSKASMAIILFSKLKSMLISQSGDLINEVILLLLELASETLLVA